MTEISFKDETFPKIKGTPEQLKMRRKWVDALRSGNYNQTTGFLKDKYGFCCLGVLCDIVHPEGWKKEFDNISEHSFDYKSNNYTVIPPEDIMNTIHDINHEDLRNGDIHIDDIPHVKYISSLFKEYTLIFSFDEYSNVCFSSLNDSDNLSFDQIADIIEHFYEIEPKE